MMGHNQGCQSNPIDGNHRLSIVIFSIDWNVQYFVDWIIDWIVQYFVDWIIIDEFSSIFFRLLAIYLLIKINKKYIVVE